MVGELKIRFLDNISKIKTIEKNFEGALVTIGRRNGIAKREYGIENYKFCYMLFEEIKLMI